MENYTHMINRLINLEVQQFRAIQNANIDLNGITVVAGENGCGKSTLSKLLYNTIKYLITMMPLLSND